MFGLGFTEIIIIFLVILIFVGPEKLPEFARNLGRMVYQLRNSADEFKREISSIGIEGEKIKEDLNVFRGIADDCSDHNISSEEPAIETVAEPVENPKENDDD